MAFPAAYYADATKVKSPEYDKATKAIRAIQAANAILLNDADVQYYVALGDQVADLTTRNKTLRADLESQDRRIANLLGEKDEALAQLGSTQTELKNLKKEKEALAAKFDAAQEALKEKHKKVASREAEFDKEVAALKRELGHERDALNKLRDFSVELKPVVNNGKEMCVNFLPVPRRFPATS